MNNTADIIANLQAVLQALTATPPTPIAAPAQPVGATQPSPAPLPSAPPVRQSLSVSVEDDVQEVIPEISTPGATRAVASPAPYLTQARRVQQMVGSAPATFSQQSLPGRGISGIGSFKKMGRGGFQIRGSVGQQVIHASVKPGKPKKLGRKNKVAFIPCGSFVREQLVLETNKRGRTAALTECLEGLRCIQKLHLLDNMDSVQITSYVEGVFKAASKPLPHLWRWAKLTASSKKFQPDLTYNPWDLDITQLADIFEDEAMAYIVPATWADALEDKKAFREQLADALDRDPATWDLEVEIQAPPTSKAKGKGKAKQELDSDVEEQNELDDPNVPKQCNWCPGRFPPDRHGAHLRICAGFQNRFDEDNRDVPQGYTPDPSPPVATRPQPKAKAKAKAKTSPPPEKPANIGNTEVMDLTGTTPDALPSAMTIPDFYNLCERQLLSMGTTQFLGVIAQVLDQHRDYELDTQSTHKPGAAAVPSFEEFAWDHNAKSPSPPAMSGGPLKYWAFVQSGSTLWGLSRSSGSNVDDDVKQQLV
ncbi:hypothetical protein HD553DRAFT_343002 [Filobasidium floriforme]|uniref:uncharacterized protein n=1 Tax=Filobasidium floriforme TaxID=5210 RepID=UPI001E8EF1DC|nr:uncharacterized protein HD553DRAFT_343002 [Filobasidium floriforme]KAH8083021.1 hypothetical protein HD553DRAFT_343002 [Filobasidium floriforme]